MVIFPLGDYVVGDFFLVYFVMGGFVIDPVILVSISSSVLFLQKLEKYAEEAKF